MLMQSFIPAEIQSELEQIRDRLANADIGALVQNAGPIQARFNEVEHILPEALARAVQPAAFIEFVCFDYLQAKRNIANRAVRRQLQSDDESPKLGVLKARATDSQSRIGKIRSEIEALEILLALKKNELRFEETNLAAITTNIQAQEKILMAAASASEAAWQKVQETCDDEEDLRVRAKIDSIRTQAIDAINAFL